MVGVKRSTEKSTCGQIPAETRLLDEETFDEGRIRQLRLRMWQVIIAEQNVLDCQVVFPV